MGLRCSCWVNCSPGLTLECTESQAGKLDLIGNYEPLAVYTIGADWYFTSLALIWNKIMFVGMKTWKSPPPLLFLLFFMLGLQNALACLGTVSNSRISLIADLEQLQSSLL